MENTIGQIKAALILAVFTLISALIIIIPDAKHIWAVVLLLAFALLAAVIIWKCPIPIPCNLIRLTVIIIGDYKLSAPNIYFINKSNRLLSRLLYLHSISLIYNRNLFFDMP